MNKHLANFANNLAAFILLFMGIIYLTKSSFMPYHSKALSLSWTELNSKTQF